MPRVPAYHSVFETRNPPIRRVYHENDACEIGRAIPPAERRSGSGGHRLCRECERMNVNEPPKSSKWV